MKNWKSNLILIVLFCIMLELLALAHTQTMIIRLIAQLLNK